MQNRFLAGLVFFAAALPVYAADDPEVTRMALCQDSWLDWQKSDPAKLAAFGNRFRTEFAHKDNDAFVTPARPASVAGLRVTQIFPNSVGMGVGFSATVAADFKTARATIEKTIGKKLAHCEKGDGMNACELAVAEKRTVMLMAADTPKSRETLVGCYYYYER
jgi:hypothetical protein